MGFILFSNYVNRYSKGIDNKKINLELYQYWNSNKFLEGFQIKLTLKYRNFSKLEIIGLDISFVNGLRRIIISETASVANDYIYMFHNSSVLNDDVVSHRLGLIPLKIDPRSMKYYNKNFLKNQFNSVIFFLKIVNLAKNHNYKKIIYSSDLKWSSYGSKIPIQTKTFFTKKQKNKVQIGFSDIVITKIKPMQKICAEIHSLKGIGMSHSKFSPVSCVWYTYFTSSFFIKNIIYFQKIIKKSKKKYLFINDHNNKLKTIKQDLYIHHKYFRNYINFLDPLLLLSRSFNIKRKDHFLFNIESCGILRPEYLLLESLFLLIQKINNIFGCFTCRNSYFQPL